MTSKRRPTVGDKVRLLSVGKHHLELGFDVGQMHKIELDYEDSFPYRIGNVWFKEERVELVEDEPDRKPIRKDYMLSLLDTLTWLINTGTVESMIIEKLKEELNNDM